LETFLDDNMRLALIRTLLAAERNNLAVERTQLSQLRTGLSLAVIAPSAGATLTYVFSYFPAFQLEIVAYALLSILTVFGVYMTLGSYSKLKKTRKTRLLIREREMQIINETELTRNYFKEIFASSNI
jgi:uncharacterized membrane protein YidH (DUF202 family)